MNPFCKPRHVVEQCDECPFFSTGGHGDPMTCEHPAIDTSKNGYAGAFIRRSDNGTIPIPKQCPLRNGPTMMRTTVELRHI